jgi:hypothetical protein
MATSRKKLKSQLAALNPNQRAAFAAGCAERVIHLYALRDEGTGGDDGAMLRQALDEVWSTLQAGPTEPAALDAWIERVDAAIPDVDFAEGAYADLAQSVAIAVLHAVRAALTGSTDDALAAWDQIDEVFDYAYEMPEADLSGLYLSLPNLPFEELKDHIRQIAQQATSSPERTEADQREQAAQSRMLELLGSTPLSAAVVPELEKLTREGRIDPGAFRRVS